MPQKKTLKSKIKPKKAPKTGDLVYCHCIGSKLGWYINKIGLVLTDNTKIKNENFRYKIYVLDEARSLYASVEEFRKDSIEVISDYSPAQISKLKADIILFETTLSYERR